MKAGGVSAVTIRKHLRELYIAKSINVQHGAAFVAFMAASGGMRMHRLVLSSAP